jgi:hypothetical protein
MVKFGWDKLKRVLARVGDYSFWAINGLRLVNAHASDHAKVTINPDEYVVPIVIGTYFHILSVATHVDSVADLDTGTLAAGTDYYV